MLAWHFLRDNMRSGEGAEPAWAVGEERIWTGPVALCHSGYHSSPSALDALSYAPGAMLCLVEVSNPVETDTATNPGQKQVSLRRRLLACADVTRHLHLFACDCAERALQRERERGREPDQRLWTAIATKRLWLDRQATDAQLAVARDAAWDTARDAGSYAAWDSARDIARDAAFAAACHAAFAAACHAASAAARDAATADEVEWQSGHLAEMVAPLFPS